MGKDNSIVSKDMVPVTDPVRTACDEIVRANIQGKSEVNGSGGTRTITRNHDINVSRVTYYLIYVSCLCDNGHTVLSTKELKSM